MIRWTRDESSGTCAQLFVLTQWNSNALNQHIHMSFPPTTFGTAQQRGFVDVLTATQTPRSTSWCALLSGPRCGVLRTYRVCTPLESASLNCLCSRLMRLPSAYQDTGCLRGLCMYTHGNP